MIRFPRAASLSSRLGLTALSLAAILTAAIADSAHAAPDPKEAVYARQVRAKAQKGDANAQYEIGRLYAKGQGVWHNYPVAAKWYLQAAKQGHVEAQLSIGILYEEGTGVARNLAKAANWYRRAAEQGDRRAQMRLGYLYGTGQGVPVDHMQAYLWYSLAAKQGDKLAAINRQAAADRLTSPELAKAQAMVRNWKPHRKD